MRSAIVIAALCATFAVVAITFRDPGGPSIDPTGLVLALGFCPVLILSGLLFVFSLFQLTNAKVRLAAVLVCLLSLPMPAVAIYKTASQMNRSKSSQWPGLALTLGDHLLDYHEENPRAFQYLGSDEEVSVVGFDDYLANLDSDSASSLAEGVRTKGGEILDPWGRPVRYGLDRNHDGYIDLQGRRVITHHMSPPSLDYKVAVAVFLSHLDNGDFRPLVRRH